MERPARYEQTRDLRLPTNIRGQIGTNRALEHFEVLSLRHATPLNLNSVTDVKCLDTKA